MEPCNPSYLKCIPKSHLLKLISHGMYAPGAGGCCSKPKLIWLASIRPLMGSLQWLISGHELLLVKTAVLLSLLLKTRWLCKKDNKRVVLTMEPNEGKTGVVFGVLNDAPVLKKGSAAEKREHDKELGGEQCHGQVLPAPAVAQS